MSPRDAAGADLTYGVLALGDADVALPLSALREVVPCPPAFDGLPVEAPGLLGAMTVRELVVPVVDLRAHAGLSAARPDSEVVVLVAQDERVVGVVADGTRDILVVPEDDLRAVQADGPLLFTATFRHPGWGGVVSVLDVPALLRLPGVPT
ncbi:MAG TPA: chemotaxis protein CheW, partial [Solirubrobacteraceae bacterium]|nr:chemotaxis protein CheW [Solirubrobacteraceae bacterium]